MKKLIFIICTEKGALEKKSLLLVKSIREFAGIYKDFDILSFAPRVGYEISQKTQDEFDKLNVKHFNISLNTDYHDYPLANKPLVCAYVEENFESEYFVFMDSDKILLNEPTELIFDDDFDVALRPVDVQNIGSTGEGDQNNEYWKKLYDIVGVKDKNYVITTVGNEKILSYWNSGLISVKSEKNLFTQWKKNFIKVMDKELTPSQGTFFVEQSVFAATVSSLELRVYEFSNTYNYPMHMQNNIKQEKKIKNMDDIITLHYHYMLDNESLFKPILDLSYNDEKKFFIQNNVVFDD